MQVVNASELHENQNLFQVNRRETLPEALMAPGNKNNTGGTVEETENGVVVDISENLKEMYQQQLEAAKENAEAAGEGFEEMAKALEIARRISNGDKVPGTDEKKLMEYDRDLYMTAKAAAILHANEKHKKYDSLYEDEEEDKDQQVRELRREAASGGGQESSPVAEAAVDVAVDGGEVSE